MYFSNMGHVTCTYNTLNNPSISRGKCTKIVKREVKNTRILQAVIVGVS
jgi:hypothetical protein